MHPHRYSGPATEVTGFLYDVRFKDQIVAIDNPHAQSVTLMKVSVIIPAAGLGTRMGRPAPEKAGISRKQFMLLSGSPILIHTIRKFVSSPLIDEIVVALREDDIAWAEEIFETHGLRKSVRT